jgi:zinc transport system substrate-binding protein
MRTFLLAGALAFGAFPALAEGPAVVASIAPVHSLAAAVMAGMGEPVLLVKGASSPHDYSLKPSDARALNAAKLVFLVDDKALESFLAKPLAALAGKAKVVRLGAAPGVKRLEPREGGAWENHDDHDHGHAKHDHHDEDELDPHLWLDPGNAKAMTEAMAAALADADPPHATAYRDNAAKTLARLDALDADLKLRLAPAAGKPFVVYHDAYQYLEAAYGLTAAGSVTVSPERKPGAKRLKAIRDKIVRLKAACVFAEPQFDPRLAGTLAEGTGARTGILDPLGAALAPGADLYPGMMENLADAVSGCLK